jgi:hypothetical protein
MYYGFSAGGIILLVVIVLLLTGRLSSPGADARMAMPHLRTPATLALPPLSLSMTARCAMAVTE